VRISSRLLAVAGTVVVLSTVVSSASPSGSLSAAPGAGPLAAPTTGRVLFAGTQHRGLGVVDGSGTGPSAPALGEGPAHFDDQPAARGELLAFTSLRDAATAQVYLRDATGTVRQLTTDRDAGDPELSPDGASVVFDSAEPGPGGIGTQRDLWLVGSDGTGLRRLTDTPADETGPSFSPDGTRLAFASDVTGGEEIYRRPLAGGTPVRLTFAGQATQPAWNPVRPELIAYTVDIGGGERRLRMIDGDESGIPVLGGAQTDWRSFSPAWHPDGNVLLFVSPNLDCVCTDINRVFQVSTEAGLPVTTMPGLLLDEDRAVDSPTWADGRLVVARTTAPDRVTATLQDVLPDGTDPRDLGLTVLREDPESATNPDRLFEPRPGFDPWTQRQNYSPDGRRMAVSRFEDVDGQRVQRIWLAQPDGSDAAPLPLSDRAAGDWETDATWSPDGRFIAFARRSPGGPGGGPSRIFVADVATGEVTAALPGLDPALDDAQPVWSPDGGSIAFTRVADIDGSLANKHIWIASAADLDDQRDLTASVCGADCAVIDDSPAFSPDGAQVAFNRKDDAILLVATDGTGCRVLLPAGQPSCAGPVAAPAGPFQPRDVAFSPDGTELVLSVRRAAAPASPEMLAVLDIASAELTPVTAALPGRQKEPSWQQTVDLTLTAPPTTPVVPLDEATSVAVTVTNNGPAPSPGTALTVAVPVGTRLDALRSEQGSCDQAALRCDLGVLAPEQTTEITAVLVGVVPGTHRVTWSVAGSVQDPEPADNTADTLVPVEAPAPPPPPPPPPPTPPAGPALAVAVTPTPGFVGGAVTVTYTARNGNSATATGLDLDIVLPARVRVASVTPGCVATGCALADLTPGAVQVVQVVLAPDVPVNTVVTGVLRTTGTDANPADNTASAPLRVLLPRIVAVPSVGKPGFVTSVRGADFPPGGPVVLRWAPGITAAAVPTRPGPDGRFIAQLLILAKDQTGRRVITASGRGFRAARTLFLVVPGVFGPPDLVVRR
jgi:Tol biopolymer transport system component